MKIRHDFVSNSSTTSFLCYINDVFEIASYLKLFDTELINETVDSHKLFEFVILNSEFFKDDVELSGLISQCCVEGFSAWGHDEIVSMCCQDHGIEFPYEIKESLVLLNFPNFLYVYMMSDKKDVLKTSIVMLAHNSCIDEYTNVVDNHYQELKQYLDQKSIKHKESTAFV
jgi:hypothetical protein